MKNSTDKTTIHSVLKSLDVLELIAASQMGLQIKEISSAMSYNISSTYHIINTLVEAGYVQKADNERFKLGYKIPFLHHKYMQSGTHSYNLSQVLAELHEETKETCYLGTEQNGEIVISEIKESRQALKVSALYVGYKDYAHARATTKIMMAYWPEAKVRAYFAQHPPKKLTPSTVTDIDDIWAELVRSREQGYCLDEEAFVKGVCCISAPIFDVSGAVTACFSVSLPAEHYWSRRKEMIHTVCSAAERASISLGFEP